MPATPADHQRSPSRAVQRVPRRTGTGHVRAAQSARLRRYITARGHQRYEQAHPAWSASRGTRVRRSCSCAVAVVTAAPRIPQCAGEPSHNYCARTLKRVVVEPTVVRCHRTLTSASTRNAAMSPATFAIARLVRGPGGAFNGVEREAVDGRVMGRAPASLTQRSGSGPPCRAASQEQYVTRAVAGETA